MFQNTPSAPSKVGAVIVSTRFITLSWDQPESTNGGEIEGYSVFYKEEGSDRYGNGFTYVNASKNPANLS